MIIQLSLKTSIKQSGQAMLLMVVLVTLVSAVLSSQASIPAKEDIALSKNLYVSKQSSLLAESGLEDVSFRIRKAWDYDLLELLRLNSFTVTTSVTTDLLIGMKTIVASTSFQNLQRSQSTSLTKNDRVYVNYGVQVGIGGFSMANSSSVFGTIYAAGPTGLISGMQVTGNAWAKTITNSIVGGTATYQTRSGGNYVGLNGVPSPGYTQAATTSFPISDAQIVEWEADAEAGGVTRSPCPYVIQTAVTLGPKKINCNL